MYVAFYQGWWWGRMKCNAWKNQWLWQRVRAWAHEDRVTIKSLFYIYIYSHVQYKWSDNSVTSKARQCRYVYKPEQEVGGTSLVRGNGSTKSPSFHSYRSDWLPDNNIQHNNNNNKLTLIERSITELHKELYGDFWLGPKRKWGKRSALVVDGWPLLCLWIWPKLWPKWIDEWSSPTAKKKRLMKLGIWKI